MACGRAELRKRLAKLGKARRAALGIKPTAATKSVGERIAKLAGSERDGSGVDAPAARPIRPRRSRLLLHVWLQLHCLTGPMPLVGVGYRHEAGPLIRRNIPPVEAVEVTVDHCINGIRTQREELEELPDLCPVFLHGVGLSLGTALPPDPEYLDQVREVARRLRVPWYSEHLAFTKVPGLDLAQLLPLPRTEEVLQIVCEHVDVVQERVGLALLLENISYYFEYPESELGEVEFLIEVCRRTGAGILLDLENLRINSINHGFDPLAFLAGLPCARCEHSISRVDARTAGSSSTAMTTESPRPRSGC